MGTQVTNGKNSMPAFGERLVRTTSRTWRATCTTRRTSGERLAAASPHSRSVRAELRSRGLASCRKFFELGPRFQVELVLRAEAACAVHVHVLVDTCALRERVRR